MANKQETKTKYTEHSSRHVTSWLFFAFKKLSLSLSLSLLSMAVALERGKVNEFFFVFFLFLLSRSRSLPPFFFSRDKASSPLKNEGGGG